MLHNTAKQALSRTQPPNCAFAMAERGRKDFMEPLGLDLSAAVFMCLEDPADLVRSASVSHTWRRFVIENRICKNLCLRMFPEISCFVRAVEVGISSDNMEIGSNFSVQWLMLESEHRIYAYLGYCIVTPRLLTGITSESFAVSSTADIIENMVSNKIVLDRISDYTSSQGKQTFKLNPKFCVVHKIKILPEAAITPNNSLTLRFRLGHMMDENANCEKPLEENYIWTYVSPIISSTKFENVLPRPVISIGGILQIEVLPKDKLASISKVEAMGSPLAPAFDAVFLNRKGNSVLMYFSRVLDSRHRSSCYRNKRRNLR